MLQKEPHFTPLTPMSVLPRAQNQAHLVHLGLMSKPHLDHATRTWGGGPGELLGLVVMSHAGDNTTVIWPKPSFPHQGTSVSLKSQETPWLVQFTSSEPLPRVTQPSTNSVRVRGPQRTDQRPGSKARPGQGGSTD